MELEANSYFFLFFRYINLNWFNFLCPLQLSTFMGFHSPSVNTAVTYRKSAEGYRGCYCEEQKRAGILYTTIY